LKLTKLIFSKRKARICGSLPDEIILLLLRRQKINENNELYIPVLVELISLSAYC